MDKLCILEKGDFMEYTNDIICKVKYIGESQKLKKNLWTRIKENKIITIVTIVFAILVIADVVLLSNFIKILSTI